MENLISTIVFHRKTMKSGLSVFWLIMWVHRYLYSCEWKELFSDFTRDFFFPLLNRYNFTGEVVPGPLSPIIGFSKGCLYKGLLQNSEYTWCLLLKTSTTARDRCWWLANKQPARNFQHLQDSNMACCKSEEFHGKQNKAANFGL